MGKKVLIVKGPTYFAPGDEKAHFDWLRSLSCVDRVGGQLRDLHIVLKRQPGDSDLRELIALFHRYKMNMKCLAVLRTVRNARWFSDDPNAFWHRKVFGKPFPARSQITLRK